MALFAFCVFGVAIYDAVGFHGAPIAGVWLEPDGAVSNTGFPDWDGLRQGLRFPDRIVEVDGKDVTHPLPDEYRATVFDRAVSDAARAGKEQVHVKVVTSEGTRELDLRIERLGSLVWWTYGGILYFSGALYIAAAVIALSVARAPLTRAFAKLAMLSALLSFTFFDLHTARHLVPIMRVAYAMSPMAMIAFALRLPDDVALLRRFPFLPRALDAAGIALAALFVLVGRFSGSAVGIELFCTLLYGFGLFAMSAILVLRFVRARGDRRALLRPLVLTLAAPHALVAGALLMHGPIKAAADIVALPLLTLTPLATMVALVRNDLWKSRTLLSRFATRAVIGSIACVVAIGFATAFSVWLGAPIAGGLLAASAAAVIATALVVPALRFGDRAFFPSLADYKPTVEQLSEELASIASPQDVVRALERIVRRWLPCASVEFLLDDPAVSAPAHVEPAALTLPVLFGGVKLGTLRLGPKPGGALFTTEDLDLLKTIVNQGGLAMAHALAYAELEKRRQQQAAAFRDEREALVETLSAEIAHEVRYPINFFRSIFQRASQVRRLDDEDIEIGCEEVERLERLVSGLRRMAVQHVERRVVHLPELCARAEVLLRDRVGSRPIAVDLGEVEAIRCDVDKVTQVLVNLLANALDATEGRGDVGISWTHTEQGGELAVWDSGPGYSGDGSQLFAPWYTTKLRGSGLGLAITSRLVSAHGWSIEPARIAGKTLFVVTIPQGDIVSISQEIEAGASADAENVRVTPKKESVARRSWSSMTSAVPVGS
ncbi:MAG: ATP-binding protein [Polyangiaceae bacterium]